MPKPGTVCKVDSPPFSNVTWGDVLEKVKGSEASENQALYLLAKEWRNAADSAQFTLQQ